MNVVVLLKSSWRFTPAAKLVVALPLMLLAACHNAPSASVADAKRRSDTAALFAEAGNVFAPLQQPWQPTRSDIDDTTPADFVVAQDGSGSHRTVQAALDAAAHHPEAAARTLVIRITPGVYRERLCVRSPGPLRIEGRSTNAVRIVSGLHHGAGKGSGESAHPCDANLDATTLGTTASSTVIIDSDDVSLRGLTIENDFTANIGQRDVQAVALTTRGDRIRLEHVHLLGHQDTAQFSSVTPASIARVQVTDSLIAGDVDFVFGRARVLFQRTRFHSRTDRIRHGFVFAPSHLQRSAFGFLVEDSIFTAGMAAEKVALARAWDHSQGDAIDAEGRRWLPNGVLVVSRSRFGLHLGEPLFAPAATTGRPYSASVEQTVLYRQQQVKFPVNRLRELDNSIDRHDPESVLAKISKTYPLARIAQAPISERVRVLRDQVYVTRGSEQVPLPLALDIYQPAELSPTQAVTVVVLVHGGAWRTGARQGFAALAQALAERGVVAVPISYRLAGEANFPAAMQDIRAAIRWLRSHATRLGLRIEHIALAGGSAGGHLAALTAMAPLDTWPERDRAARDAELARVQSLINIDGLSDTVAPEIRAFEDAPDKVFPALAEFLGARYAEQPALWQAASPLAHVNNAPDTDSRLPPTLFLHGSEARFSLGREPMRAALTARGIYSEVKAVDAPHSFWLLDPWLQPTADAIVAFLQRCPGGCARFGSGAR